MKRHHKLLVAGVLLLALAWLSWNVLLVESDTETPIQTETR